MSFESKLKKYASLLVKSGLNVQQGQIVLVEGSIESYELAREVAKEAYALGAKEVVVKYTDSVISKLKYDNLDINDFNEVPKWLEHYVNDYANAGAAFLFLTDTPPDALKGVDPRKLSAWSKAYRKQCHAYYDLADSMQLSWCIAGSSSTKWANKVFPDMSDKEAKDALWQAIFKTAKIDENNDPNVTWQKHRQSFEKRVKVLNESNLESVTYHNSKGTDVTVGLPEGYLFAGGGSFLTNGVYCFPNIPTEEIFASPDRNKVNGKICSTLPLNYQGNLINDFYIVLENGRIVDYGAKEGYESLKEIIEFDEGSHYLGELALIPYDSPINNMNLLFYNTLYDENASCHFAIGNGFAECIENGYTLSKEELLEKGVNHSNIHVDFMVGSDDLEIIGKTKDGQELVIFKDGNFAF